MAGLEVLVDYLHQSNNALQRNGVPKKAELEVAVVLNFFVGQFNN